MLKHIIASAIGLVMVNCTQAQVVATADTTKKAIVFPPLDKSPLDYSYYPVNFPSGKLSNKNKEALVARVIYSRPQKNGRVIFGNLVEYGKMWRFGANENTEIEFYQKVKIGNTTLPKGRYSIFCIPTVKDWTIIINKDLNCWGNFSYKAENDVAKITVPVEETTEVVEAFTIVFNKLATQKNINMVVAWDNFMALIPFTPIP